MAVVIGWDIGGAHLKAARVEGGRVVATVQVASPLRRGLPQLAVSFAEAKARMGVSDSHAITMTGELADTFASHAEGVVSLTEAALAALSPARLHVYAGRSGFVVPERAAQYVADIASANWHASASVLARVMPDALFMDMGSTTTDIIPVVNGTVAARGYTDAERLASGELVYTGLVRSFLMATETRAPFAGQWTRLISENFASMADVHRILGQLPDGADQMTTADGREKTVAASRARLARMVGRDAADANDAAWTGLALWFAEAQIRAIVEGAMLVLSQGKIGPGAPIVTAGSGAIVLREVARRLGRDCAAYAQVVAADASVDIAACAPAAAVALLAADEIKLQ